MCVCRVYIYGSLLYMYVQASAPLCVKRGVHFYCSPMHSLKTGNSCSVFCVLLRGSIAVKKHHDRGHIYKRKQFTGLGLLFQRLIHYQDDRKHGRPQVDINKQQEEKNTLDLA